MIGLCTDSTAQVPAELRARHAIEVVPATVVIDGLEHLDDPDVDHGPASVVTVVEPSSGQFAATYDELVANGCTEILSFHAGATLSTARLAAHATAVPVRVIDVGEPGFALTCAVWAAGEAIARGAAADQAVTVAERAVARLDHLFMVGVATGVAGIELERITDDAPEVVVRCDTVFDAINALAARVIATGARLRVAVGHSDPSTVGVAEALEAAIGEPANVIDVVRYRIGASAAQAAPGTVGCYWFPAE